MVITIVSSSCAVNQNQPAATQPPPSPETTATPVPATFTSTPTRILKPTASKTPIPTATPTFVLPTLPPDCGIVKLGHAGTQVIDHTEKILIQGTAIMCGADRLIGNSLAALPVLQSMLDLDSGTFNIEDADIYFCPGGGSTLFYYFCDVNHTLVRKYQAYEKPKQPPFEECLGTKPYSGVDDDEAKYLCVVTTLGNVSRVKVEQYDPVDGTLSFKISFITWEK
jgi:hypothetical protein